MTMTFWTALACLMLATSLLAFWLNHGFRRWLGIGAVLAIVLQMVVEGPIAQMFPAYLATILIAARLIIDGRTWFWLRAGASGSAALLVTVSAAVFWFMPIFDIPEPTGPYRVGTRFVRIDLPDRDEPFTPDRDDHRTLYAQIWYPADVGADAPMARYWTNSAAYAQAVARFQSRWQPMFGWMYWHMGLVKTDAAINAPVHASNERFPLIIHSHGHPVDPFNSNTALLQDLASRGFVTVALVHPYETPAAIGPDGEIIIYDIENLQLNRRIDELQSEAHYAQARRWRSDRQVTDGWDIHSRLQHIMPALSNSVTLWEADISDFIQGLSSGDAGAHAIAQITDFERVGLIGFSLGGATATSFCSHNPICDAGVNLDGYLFGDVREEALNVPFLFMNSSSNAGMNDFYFLEAKAATYRVTIPASEHINFTDFTLAGPYMRALNATGAVDGHWFDEANRAVVGNFFTTHLGSGEERWSEILERYPELDVVERNTGPAQ
jgi:hypothetical protein